MQGWQSGPPADVLKKERVKFIFLNNHMRVEINVMNDHSLQKEIQSNLQIVSNFGELIVMIFSTVLS